MNEKSIGKQEVYKGRVIKLDVHDVELSNGKKSKREIISHPGAVAVVAVDEKQHILMVRQYRFAAQKVLLEVPAGTLNIGENPLEAAPRELREETGYRPQHIERIGGIYVAPGYTTEYIHLFYAHTLVYDPLEMDDDEMIDVERLSFAEVFKKIESGEIEDGKSISSILQVARKLGF
jgi:ADP-ribose pyrophosphatase